MPLVAHSKLPTFGVLREQGHELLSLDEATHQDIRELHVGFLNVMPALPILEVISRVKEPSTLMK